MSIGFRNVMVGLVASAVFLCAQSAFSQTRPTLSEVFRSHVTIEITTGTGADAETVEGVGEVTFNQPAGQAREFYKFHGGPPTEVITRYDLGAIYHIEPPTCEVEEVTGAMPPFWGWVANSKMGPGVVVHGIEGTLWVSTGTAPNPTQILAATNDGKTALYYEVTTPEQTVRITYLKWQTTFKPKAGLFKPPHTCPK